jgi:hypothetical protein
MSYYQCALATPVQHTLELYAVHHVGQNQPSERMYVTHITILRGTMQQVLSSAVRGTATTVLDSKALVVLHELW